MTSKQLLYGVGLNDADYEVFPTINGKREMCPYYAVWRGMIRRCYVSDEKRRKQESTYKGCTVVKEWHVFSNFKSWMEKQDWEGKQLDKDLKVHGNKIYGPDTCVFIPKEINILISEGQKSSYGLLKGLTMDHGRIRARIRKYGKLHQIGNFDNEQQAHEAWLVERKKYILEVAENSEYHIKKMLINWMESEYDSNNKNNLMEIVV